MQVLFLFVFEENLKISIPLFPEHFLSCRKENTKFIPLSGASTIKLFTDVIYGFP
jgi:hypothetical protein